MTIVNHLSTIWRGFPVAILVTALWVSPVQSQGANPAYTLKVDGLACPFCAYGIEKQLGEIEGVEKIETDMSSGTVTVIMKEDATMNVEKARQAVEAAGFTLRGFAGKGSEQ